MDWIIPILIVVVFFVLSIFLVSRYFLHKNSRTTKVIDNQEEQLLDEIFEKVVILLEDEKYFLSKSIKVSDMAIMLSFNEKLISKSINKHWNDNFNSFINDYRIRYAQELFKSGNYDHYTIEAIADESGFSNKVSFYNAFKSKTGMSPKQFKALKH